MNPSLDQTAASDTAASLKAGQLWEKALAAVKRELSDQAFRNWIEPTQLIEFREGLLTLGVPDRFYADWLKDRYQEIIRQAVSSVAGIKPEIRYVIQDRSFNPASSPASAPQRVSKLSAVGLNENYTFDRFVVGPANRFAHAALVAVSEAPAKQYNPLFIYGRVGLGKTHLMQAAARAVLVKSPEQKVVYISGEKFTIELISAIQTRSTASFRARYRNTDILLVDDIHFIAGKESTQEEFFHTFNALYDAHKQIIVCSDRPPRDIPGLEDRLISRFAWGLVVDIQPPDFETRVAILKKKMEEQMVSVPDDVVYFVADKIKSNIRELEGALIRVVAYSSLTGRVVDVNTVGEILRGALNEEVGRVTIDQIQKCVAEYFGVKISDLRAKRRSRSVAHPRQVAMYLVRTLTDHSLPEIGGFFGGRGHATVIHAYNKIVGETGRNAKTQQTVDDIKLLIRKG